jgi:hypothetical protein
MTLNEYQEKAMETAVPAALQLDYMVLGLANETGKVAGKLKKLKRGDFDKPGQYPNQASSAKMIDGGAFKAQMMDDLGDAYWYLAGCATALGVTLEDVAAKNLAKLADRKARGVIKGSGDKR